MAFKGSVTDSRLIGLIRTDQKTPEGFASCSTDIQISIKLLKSHFYVGVASLDKYEGLISEENKQLREIFEWLGFSLSDKQNNIIDVTRPTEVGRLKRTGLGHGEVDKIDSITQEIRYELGY